MNFDKSLSYVPKTEASVAQVRPWVRYWARAIDTYLATIVIGFIIGILNPDVSDETVETVKNSEKFFGLIVLFVWVFLESLLLSTIGTTPGKWLLKTRIITHSGAKPNYSTALTRSLKVWWRGLGIGFPIATLITLNVAHKKLKKDGVTSWDHDGRFTVMHEKIGGLRVFITIIIVMGVSLLLLAAGTLISY